MGNSLGGRGGCINTGALAKQPRPIPHWFHTRGDSMLPAGQAGDGGDEREQSDAAEREGGGRRRITEKPCEGQGPRNPPGAAQETRLLVFTCTSLLNALPKPTNNSPDHPSGGNRTVQI